MISPLLVNFSFHFFVILMYMQFYREFTPKSFLYLSSPVASKHSNFYSPKFQPLKCLLYPDEIHLERTDFGSRHFETVYGDQPVFM